MFPRRISIYLLYRREFLFRNPAKGLHFYDSGGMKGCCFPAKILKLLKIGGAADCISPPDCHFPAILAGLWIIFSRRSVSLYEIRRDDSCFNPAGLSNFLLTGGGTGYFFPAADPSAFCAGSMILISYVYKNRKDRNNERNFFIRRKS